LAGGGSRVQAGRLDLHDLDRLTRLLNDAQCRSTGLRRKAHPAEEAGKHQLQAIFRRALDSPARRPRRIRRRLRSARGALPRAGLRMSGSTRRASRFEASGTSGHESIDEPALHLSIGDGLVAEGFTGANGWQIDGAAYGSRARSADAAAPTRSIDSRARRRADVFYERDARGLPRPLDRDGSSRPIATITPRFLRVACQGLRPGPMGRAPDSRNRQKPAGIILLVARKSTESVRCTLCGNKNVTEPRGDERYCRDCWTRSSRSRTSSARVHAEALHPRAQRREVPRLSLQPETAGGQLWCSTTATICS